MADASGPGRDAVDDSLAAGAHVRKDGPDRPDVAEVIHLERFAEVLDRLVLETGRT